MPLGIIAKDLNGVTVLELSGQIALGDDCNRLRAKIKEVLSLGKSELVLDMAKVSYIDSTGLGTMLAVYTTARNQGANIKLASLAKKFREQLHMTKLETVFEIYEGVEDALKSYRQTS